MAWATGGTSCNLGIGLKAKEHIYNSLDQYLSKNKGDLKRIALENSCLL